jgi:hypothetical protein
MFVFRLVAAAVVALLLFVVGAFFWSMFVPNAGQLDAIAARRIRAYCGFRSECKIQAQNLFDGDWDTFLEFGAGMSQDEINQVLGTSSVHHREGQRTLIFSREGHIVQRGYENDGADHPLAGEVLFGDEHHRDQNWIHLRRDSWLRVNSFPVDSADQSKGIYFILNTADAP